MPRNNELRLNSKERIEKLGSFLLFVITFLFVLIKLMQRGTMIDWSSDAADIWWTIREWGTEGGHASYVMYKGFSSIYPYLWFYRLASLLKLNEFFFVMCYHAVLFSYIAVIGVPVLIEALTEYKTKLWQKIVLVVVLYWFWSRYFVIQNLMVDLPSCAFFLMSVHCAVLIAKHTGWKRYAFIIITGLLAGLIANISGQYSISAICVFAFAMVKLWKSQPADAGKIQHNIKCLLALVLMIVFMLVPRWINAWFQGAVIASFLENGAWIPSADFWMERALVYMLGVSRKFYGADLTDPRGVAIIMGIYGKEEGMRLLEEAVAGNFGWSITEWFQAFFKHPADFIVTMLNRLMILMSDDMRTCSLRSLLPGYTMIYMAVMTVAKRMKKLRDLFQAKVWLALAALASIIPSLVMCVEPRVSISFQCLFFGVALAGPIIPLSCATVVSAVKQCWQDRSLRSLMDRSFPWAFIGWVIFCLVCLAYYGSLCAASGLGTDMLFRW